MSILKKLWIVAVCIMSQIFATSYTIKEPKRQVKATFTNPNPAFIVDNDYERDDVFVADICVSSKQGYSVDPTGKEDSTLAIQTAINDCEKMGGGTVYLPAGKYKVTSRIEIKPYVNLRGDYRDPDTVKDGDYGTIIVAGVKSSNEDVGEAINLFRMDGSSALIGLTFFYPLQFMDAVMPYGYAIEVPGGLDTNKHNVFTIKDITFLNAYKGICASITPSGMYKSITHEQLHLENIKGTILREGFHLTNSSEVGGIRNIFLNSSYWANAGKEFNAPNAKNIDDFTTKNSVGMILGDLEWHEVQNVEIKNYHTGIYFQDGTRATTYSMSFIGTFYDLRILNATYGIYIEQLYANMGIEFAQSEIQASKYAMINHSPESDGHVKMSGVTYTGEIGGVNVYWDGKLKGEIPELDLRDRYYQIPKLKLYNVIDYGADNLGKKDASVAIQFALNDARDAGGGVVYLPAGYYLLQKPLYVYENTQLRGCTNAVQKDLTNNCKGTLILAKTNPTATPDTDDGLINLVGKDAGVSGLRVIYPDLDLSRQIYTESSFPKYAYTIKGKSDGVYATNLYLTGCYNGIDFSSNCNDYLIKRVLGVFYHIGFYCGGNRGTLDTLLSNGIALTKVSKEVSGWDFTGDQLQTNIYQVTRQTTTLVKMNHAQDLMVGNVFTFASNTFIDAYDSTFYGFNVGQDSQPANGGKMFALHASEGVFVNTLRDACGTLGTYYTADETSKFSVYNRITLLPGNQSKTEGNIIENGNRSMAPIANTPEVATIEKIWAGEIDYEFIDYPEEKPDPVVPSVDPNDSTIEVNSEPEVKPEPEKNPNHTALIVSLSIIGALIVGVILYFIIKSKIQGGK